VNENETSLLRDVIGFLVGGLVAGIASVLVFLAFVPLPPEPKPTDFSPDYTGVALTILILVTFFCGGFIGRRAFSADFWSDLLPSVVTSYAVIGFLCLLEGLDMCEVAPMVGFSSAGIIISAIALIFLGRRFPPKVESLEQGK
jgi:hypothetical protein